MPSWSIPFATKPETNMLCATMKGATPLTMFSKKPKPQWRSGWLAIKFRSIREICQSNLVQRNNRKYHRRQMNSTIGKLTKTYQ